jgi:hypothetical protein
MTPSQIILAEIRRLAADGGPPHPVGSPEHERIEQAMADLGVAGYGPGTPGSRAHGVCPARQQAAGESVVRALLAASTRHAAHRRPKPTGGGQSVIATGGEGSSLRAITPPDRACPSTSAATVRKTTL